MRDRTVRKAVVDFHINEDTITDTSRPADYSFHKYARLEAFEIPKARENRVGIIPLQGKLQRKFLTKAIWLNNNKLKQMDNLEETVESLLESPEKVEWLDFSHNKLTHIDKSILKYKNLCILYFHGNKISDVSTIAVLRPLKKLHNITFQGNPIALRPEYRSYIINLLPQVKNLDFSPIIKLERLTPAKPHALKLIMSILEDIRNKKDEGNQSAMVDSHKDKVDHNQLVCVKIKK